MSSSSDAFSQTPSRPPLPPDLPPAIAATPTDGTARRLPPSRTRPPARPVPPPPAGRRCRPAPRRPARTAPDRRTTRASGRQPAPRARAAAFHAAGTAVCGSASCCRSSVVGGGLSAQPATAAATAAARIMRRTSTRASVQLQHEVIGDRADAQDHHAHDVDRLHVLGVDCACALRAGGKKQLAVALGDSNLTGNRPGTCG